MGVAFFLVRFFFLAGIFFWVGKVACAFLDRLFVRARLAVSESGTAIVLVAGSWCAGVTSFRFGGVGAVCSSGEVGATFSWPIKATWKNLSTVAVGCFSGLGESVKSVFPCAAPRTESSSLELANVAAATGVVLLGGALVVGATGVVLLGGALVVGAPVLAVGW